MSAWEIALLTTVAVLLLAASMAGTILLLLGRSRARRTPVATPAPALPRSVRVTIDVDAHDGGAAHVARLLSDAAGRLFAQHRSVTTITFHNRSGELLGTRTRSDPRIIPPAPLDMVEPHIPAYRRARARNEQAPESGPVGRSVGGAAARWLQPPDAEPAGRPFAERFDLPDVVRERLNDPADEAGVIAAILEAAGREVVADGDLLRSGDAAVVLLNEHIPSGEVSRALDHAYFRFTASRASRGLVIALGPWVDPLDVHRREAMEPRLRHVGPMGVQRMADAVASGADPIAFAHAPVLTIGEAG